MELDLIIRSLESAGLLAAEPDDAASITGVADDSRCVAAGTLFCAIEGTAQDGHAYLADAVARGASAALVTRRQPLAIPQVVVRNSRAAAAVAARQWYGRPADSMTLVGVTGTNGKSTTVALIRHLLNTDGTVGSIGTLGAVDGRGDRLPGHGSLTTPGAIEFQSLLAEFRVRGMTTVIIEASSHGLDQGRLETATFGAAVYTNLTHEHLDYHADLASYAAAKMKLSQHLGRDSIEVVNGDDPTWAELPNREGVRRICYGRNPDADVSAVHERLGPHGSDNVFRFDTAERRVRLPLLGDYNVSNALAAAATAWGLGRDADGIAARLADAPQVPGRMEQIVSGRFTVLRDYAHTPDGFERAIGSIRRITSGRLLVLFGAGGDRDREKRPVMGRIAARQADLVFISSDNPRTEDAERILDDIEQGMGEAVRERVTDREEAIRQAVSQLEPGDCLLLLGKGHETYQLVGTEKLPFDERAIVEDAVGELVVE